MNYKRDRAWLSLIAIGLLLLLWVVAAEAMTNPDCSVAISLSKADLTLVGESPVDWTGYFASPAGDVNGDGLGDLIIGAPMGLGPIVPPLTEPQSWGLAYLVLGRPREEWLTDTISLAEADASFEGCAMGTMTARQLYTAGDVNGDGFDDLLVSGWKCEPHDRDPLLPKTLRGKAYLFLGRPDVEYWGQRFPVEQADASFLGERDSDMTAYYVATAGDVNADGLDDFLVTNTRWEITPTYSITDTHPDAIGKVYLFLGRSEADWGTDFDVAQADATFLGEAIGDHLGRAAVGVGDVNGDGYGDFLMSAMSNDYNGPESGQNYLFLGRAAPGDPGYDPSRPWWGHDFVVSAADATFVGEAEGDESGRRVAWGGDVNGDGYDDMLFVAGRNDQVAPEAGKAYLVLGRPEADWGRHYPLAQADASFLGEEANDEAGRRLGTIGDVNADGFDDFIIGAPHSNQGGELAGVAYLFYGRPEADWGLDFPMARANIRYIGKAEPGSAGYDMGWLGDFDGDGMDDYYTVAFGGRHEEAYPGEVYVMFGTQQPRCFAHYLPLSIRAFAEKPQPVQFLPSALEGVVGGWWSFACDYQDPDGWQDIERVELLMGQDEADPRPAHVAYDVASNELYLSERTSTRWLGPCTPGEDLLLSADGIELHCKGSLVLTRGTDEIRVIWRLRWLDPIAEPVHYNAYLRAVDRAAHDSGLVQMGTWTLLPSPE